MPVDISWQTVKNSGPSQRKAAQGYIFKYIWSIFLPGAAIYPKMSLYGLTLTKSIDS